MSRSNDHTGSSRNSWVICRLAALGLPRGHTPQPSGTALDWRHEPPALGGGDCVSIMKIFNPSTLSILAAAAILVGCSSNSSNPTPSGETDGSTASDAGSASDGATTTDA